MKNFRSTDRKRSLTPHDGFAEASKEIRREMTHQESETKARMTANLADFLELLSLTRGRVLPSG
jgi:hypothetical protein